MKKQIFTMLVLTVSAFTTRAQNFDPVWASKLQRSLDSMSDRYNGEIGVTAAVYMPGQGLWTGVAGESSPGVPMDRGMRVLIASNSKLFMSVTMLKLQEQNVLSLEDHIGKWIPRKLNNVDTSATIRQLLSHESGIADFFWGREQAFTASQLADTSHYFTPQEMVDSTGTPIYPKGRGYSYSNTGYAICAMIVEAATGYDYWKNLQALILDPLQMDSTFAPMHHPYQPISGSNYYGGVFSDWAFTSFMSPFAGSGDLASTPQEMVQWYSKVFGGQVLADSSLRQLIKVDPASHYGLGIEEHMSPTLGGIYSHGAWIGAFTSETIYDKDTKACLFLAMNTYNDTLEDFMPAFIKAFQRNIPKQANDAAITALLSPTGITCNATVSPVVELKNMGTTALTVATIHLSVDGGSPTGYNWTGTLIPDATASVALPALAMTNGMHKINVYTSMPNGVADGNSWNDTFSTRIAANLTTSYNGYFSEGFEASTTPVLVWSTNNGIEGQAGVSHLAGLNSTHSMGRACSMNADYGNVSNIDMPAVTLATGSSSQLKFSYAYSEYPDMADSLEALISTDCGISWTSLFYKGGKDLALNLSTSDIYYPQSAAEWKTEVISLSSYTGDVLVRFRMVNGWGNNLYLDNIEIGIPTSVNTVKNPKVAVYPNPAQEQVFVSGLPVATLIQLSSITGQVMSQTTTVNDRTTLDVSILTPGVYVISTQFGVFKIVKQ